MSKQNPRLNDSAWEQLFSKYHILDEIAAHGLYQISADQIKEFREPRLMAKFDHRINLPQIFSDNGLAILPVSRGDYVISHFEAYHDFEHPVAKIQKVRLPDYLCSLSPSRIISETVAIHCAYASGMLADFLEEDLLIPTLSGRMGSGQFDFFIQNTHTHTLQNIHVQGAQIEIDAAFEGHTTLGIFEAKRDISADFLIRQLYYPFQTLSTLFSKKIKPIFFVYSNGIFRFYQYEFEDPSCYNSLQLTQYKQYTFEDISIDWYDIRDLAQQIVLQEEPAVPFPQADNFERIINLCELLDRKPLSREELTQKYAFDIRQTNYYTDAARYLGLIEKKNENNRPYYVLTRQAKQILSYGYRNRQLAFCRCILSHKVFFDAFAHCENGLLPSRDTLLAIMHASNLYHVTSESTYIRRASTICGWLRWIFSLTKQV